MTEFENCLSETSRLLEMAMNEIIQANPEGFIIMIYQALDTLESSIDLCTGDERNELIKLGMLWKEKASKLESKVNCVTDQLASDCPKLTLDVFGDTSFDPKYDDEEMLLEITAFKTYLRDRVSDAGNTVEWSDIVGYDDLKNHIYFSYIISPYSMNEPLMLFGAPGVGKSLIVKALISSLKYNCVKIKEDDLQENTYDQVGMIKAKFQLAKDLVPSVLYLDKIENNFTEGLITKTHGDWALYFALKHLVVDVQKYNECNDKKILFVAESNFPRNLNTMIWTRIGHRYHVPMPDRDERRNVLAFYFGDLSSVLSSRNWNDVLDMTRGWSNGNMKNLCEQIKQVPMRKVLNKSKPKLGVHWIPCLSKTNKVPVTLEEIMTLGDKIDFPGDTLMDIIIANKLHINLSNAIDFKSSVINCEEFAGVFGSHVITNKDFDPPEPTTQCQQQQLPAITEIKSTNVLIRVVSAVASMFEI